MEVQEISTRQEEVRGLDKPACWRIQRLVWDQSTKLNTSHLCLKQNFLSSFTPSVSKQESDMVHWMEWVVMQKMPLAEVDNKRFLRRYGLKFVGAIFLSCNIVPSKHLLL